MPQQCNEASPTSLPCAITYSIKLVVVSQVIVMNMPAVNFLVSQSLKEEARRVDKACELIGFLVAAGRNWWRLMLQTRTKCSKWDAREQQCSRLAVRHRHGEETLSRKERLEDTQGGWTEQVSVWTRLNEHRYWWLFNTSVWSDDAQSTGGCGDDLFLEANPEASCRFLDYCRKIALIWTHDFYLFGLRDEN